MSARRAALPRRPRRQPAAPARAARRPARTTPPAASTTTSCARIEDEAIRDVVTLQEDVGLQGVTDGEFRRASWHMDFIYQIGGITKARRQPEGAVPQRGGRHRVHARRAAGRRQARRSTSTIFADDFEFLREHVDGADAEADDPVAEHGPLPRRPRRDRPRRLSGPRGVLGRPDRRLRASRSRRSASSAAPTCSSTTPAWPTSTIRRSASTSPRSAATASTSTRPTSATSTRPSPSRPAGMAVTTHMCRGNFRSSWVAEGGYDFVAEALFNELDVDGFFLEYDDARSGGFEPLRFVPKGKFVVLGLVTTKSGELEQQGRAQAPDRGGVAVRAARPALPVAAVRASPPPSRATRR